MSINHSPSLLELPIELLYRIVDHLDAQTIFLSFRNVCTLFHTITNASNRCVLDLSSSSKANFHLICRLVHPENVISITISDDEKSPGQIGLFFSLFHIGQFIRLRSLTLQNIDSKDLNTIFINTNECSLTSVSFISRGKRNKSTLDLLSILNTQHNLQHLRLNTYAHNLDKIFSSKVQYKLRQLIIGTCTYQEYDDILRNCPHLETLVIDDCWMIDIDKIVSRDSLSTFSRQLTTLSVMHTNRSMDQLESLLSLTPLLTNLKLVNSSSTCNSLIDGSRWENFIKTKLFRLKKFEFFFQHQFLRTYNFDADVQLLILPFRTLFWIEHKHWFVTCDYIKRSHRTKLYSIPFPVNSFEYNFDSDKISMSTTTEKYYDITTMDGVHRLSYIMTGETEKQVYISIVLKGRKVRSGWMGQGSVGLQRFTLS
jgi:hypothetical protein